MTLFALPRLRTTTWARAGAIAAAALVVCSVVTIRSVSAFTSTTTSTSNLLQAASVSITDDKKGAALFTVANMRPGDRSQACIEVTYTGTLVGADKLQPVMFYGTAYGNKLYRYLDLSVERGRAGTTCAAIGTPDVLFDNATPTSSPGTLKHLHYTHDTYAKGLDGGPGRRWTPAVTGEMRPYRITMTLGNDNEAQGRDTRPNFFWEIHSKDA